MSDDLIPVYSKDDSKDYLKILKSLNEIPFPVGKKLLADFLTGSYSNKSITKNDLFDLHNFNSLRYEREEVMNLIKKLIAQGLIDVSGTRKNKFWKVLSITRKGQQELQEPSLYKNKIKNKLGFDISEVSEEDRRKFSEMESLLDKYNDDQKKAIISDSDKILCIAGAGSGKTTVLTKRIEFLVKYRGIDPKEILAITFTRKAREEMMKRLRGMKINTNVETFNSFCEKTLRKNEREIYGEKKDIESYKDKIQMFRATLEELNIEIENAIDKYFSYKQKEYNDNERLFKMLMKDCFFILEYFKRQGQDFYDFSKDCYEDSAEMIYKICKKLKENRERKGMRSFNDQIIDAIHFFKKGNAPKFEHVLVDEYQDVNSMQVEILNLLKPKNLFCVGDPRQSIFGWRGSDINYILNFQKKHNAEVISLEKNYRSNSYLVKLMNFCIKDLGLPDLESSFRGDRLIDLKEFDDEVGEFEFVAEKIKETNVRNEKIFVLARTNRQLKELAILMDKYGIPYVIRSDENDSLRKGRVALSTIHSIKGMEAELVFVIGCNNKNFPCKASDHPVIDMVKREDYDNEAEEKRLFYVAISRAKRQLYMTYSGEATYFINQNMKDML